MLLHSRHLVLMKFCACQGICMHKFYVFKFFVSFPTQKTNNSLYVCVFFFVQVHVILLSVLSTPNDPQLIITNSNYKFAIF